LTADRKTNILLEIYGFLNVYFDVYLVVYICSSLMELQWVLDVCLR
jgi:hypothetical protein